MACSSQLQASGVGHCAGMPIEPVPFHNHDDCHHGKGRECCTACICKMYGPGICGRHHSNIQRLQVVFHTLLAEARDYGLQPNMDKTLHLQVQHSTTIFDPWGAEVKTVGKVKYLGGILTADGDCSSAVTARIGEARSSFNKLEAVWKHSSITIHKKIQFFKACVVTKLLYGVEIYCLRKAERDRIDAFQALCLRKILKIPHSMISHVSNKAVLQQAGEIYLSTQLLIRQVILFGRVALQSTDSLMRRTIFHPNSYSPTICEGPR